MEATKTYRHDDEVKVVDMVNRPPHYTGNGIECIDAMESAFGREAVIAFCKGNAFKYIWRCNKKNNTVEDLEKAKWYISKAIDLTNKGVKDGI